MHTTLYLSLVIPSRFSSHQDADPASTKDKATLRSTTKGTKGTKFVPLVPFVQYKKNAGIEHSRKSKILILSSKKKQT